MEIGTHAGMSIYHRERNVVLRGPCLCVRVCAEGIEGRASVGQQSWEGHHCLITAMLVTSS